MTTTNKEGASAYLSNADADIAAMLEAVGASRFEDLLTGIPAAVRMTAPIPLAEGMSEMEILRRFETLAGENQTYDAVFAGAGAYDHYTPSLVRHILLRPEFYTAYTPYQAEISQGTLQAMYEFQTAVGLLTGMEVANASMYDGASALAEAVRMAVNITRKHKILISRGVHPHHREVIATYMQGLSVELIEIPLQDGATDPQALDRHLDDETAAVVVQHPNFYGRLEPMETIRSLIRQYPKPQFVVSFYPIAAGLIKAPGEYDADIVTGEGQALGLPLSFGGPYLGLFATRQKYIRRMPGRLAGRTIDAHGNEGYVLTLQTREQHIKRDRATSNICTNQGLMALAALIYLTWLGKEGLKAVAAHSYANAHYLARNIAAVRGFHLKYDGPFFNEFVITASVPTEKVMEALQAEGFLPGVNLARWGQEGLLVAATEKRTREEMDRYAALLEKL